jgi:hypothetical protein
MVSAAGVYFVAARLSAMDVHCALTIRNVPDVDILISNVEGSALAALQVKTATSASRRPTKGPSRYEWDIGPKSARLNSPSLWFALVDLKEFKALPDIFFVPSKVMAEYFRPGMNKRPMYKETEQNMEQYKNCFDGVLEPARAGMTHGGGPALPE